MTSSDLNRLKRVIVKLEAAIDVFRRSSTKPTVGDIGAETDLTQVRTELRKVIASDVMSPEYW
jgi:hypothetical protein